jgi:hypothetical protein
MIKAIAVPVLLLILGAPAFSQDVAKADKPKVQNPEAIPPTTACEGMTGALPEAISECQKRETVRLFIILGKPEAAVRILCTAKVAKDAFKDNVDACQRSN